MSRPDLGIAHDGDGDRVRFVDSLGRIVHGDQILGLLALQTQQDGNLKSSKFVTTIYSNSGLLSSLNKRGISTLTSDVGDRNVYLKMVEEGCNWGGGIIRPYYLHGLFAYRRRSFCRPFRSFCNEEPISLTGRSS